MQTQNTQSLWNRLNDTFESEDALLDCARSFLNARAQDLTLDEWEALNGSRNTRFMYMHDLAACCATVRFGIVPCQSCDCDTHLFALASFVPSETCLCQDCAINQLAGV